MDKSEIQALCRRRFLQLIADYGLPDPDEVQLEVGWVRFIWNEQQVIVTIDLDEFLDRDTEAALGCEGLTA